MTAADIVASCEGSLRRLQTEVIDLYQIHWPERHVPAFGALYYDPAKERSQTPSTSSSGAGRLVQAGKVRHIGLSNETPTACTSSCAWPSSTACRAWPRCRTLLPDQPQLENGLDETCHRLACRCWPIRRWASAC
jgi:aryl-alcohol dehydrogenase-like predicted oxidoreductase